eukprot:TRINITY_DN8550_c0_g1_i1.p2 TRINITY_DN8550_c0_g1~~TRINITY_DN8550_c0_g1_i1.p2  ORF type:complete len:118 (+),score=24.40 TRINITY_DN8550_c0_g1_i1:398-751(+)
MWVRRAAVEAMGPFSNVLLKSKEALVARLADSAEVPSAAVEGRLKELLVAKLDNLEVRSAAVEVVGDLLSKVLAEVTTVLSVAKTVLLVAKLEHCDVWTQVCGVQQWKCWGGFLERC